MRRVALRGHYDRTVEVDLCDACDLVWFDGVETANLSGPGMLALVGEMARAYAVPHETLRHDAACPRCGGVLRTVHNRSRWGATLQLDCGRGDGTLQSFEQFLNEKGLLRAMTASDRRQLLAERGGLNCMNCGGAIGATDAACPWCRTAPAMLDVARLARAFDPEGALAPAAVHERAAEARALGCAACGAALAEPAIRCPSCAAVLAIPSLVEAHAAVEALAPALRAHVEKPAPAVVARRLAALDADLPRRRRFVQDMNRDAAGASAEADHEDGDGWRSGFDNVRGGWLGVGGRIALAVVVFLLVARCDG
jgi:Zn-finger nucleic acid-binding protein